MVTFAASKRACGFPGADAAAWQLLGIHCIFWQGCDVPMHSPHGPFRALVTPDHVSTGPRCSHQQCWLCSGGKSSQEQDLLVLQQGDEFQGVPAPVGASLLSSCDTNPRKPLVHRAKAKDSHKTLHGSTAAVSCLVL